MPGPAALVRPAGQGVMAGDGQVRAGNGRLLGWLPLQALMLLAGAAAALPLARARMDPFGPGMVRGGISVDTDGATGTIADGRFRLDLPLTVNNRTDNVVVGVSIWTEAWACPGALAPLPACRRLISTGQDFVPRLLPESAAAFPTVLTGGVPAGVADGATVRIERRIENIYDDRDTAREAAHAAVRR
jgi:hypothetical protein